MIDGTVEDFRIGVDLDGVVYNWSDTSRFLLEWEFGIEVAPSMYWNHIMDQISPDQWKWLWSEGIERGLFRHGNCYKGSFEALKTVSDLGDIVILTHRPESAVLDTTQWIGFHQIPTDEIYILHRQEPKSSIDPKCHIYVDDKAENCIDLYENTGGVVCMWDRPWNEQEQKNGFPKGIHVISSWADFTQLAKETKWKFSQESSV